MTPTPLSLRRNFSWTFAGNLIYAGCLWGILSVLTKLGSPATVGRFALASAVASPIIMFASLQLRSALASDAADQHEFRDYFTLRLLSLPAALAVVYVVAVISYSPSQVLAIILFGGTRAIDMVSDMFYGLAQKSDRMDIVAISRVIRGITALLLFGLTFHLTQNLNLALVAMGVAWLLVLVFFDIPRINRLNRSLGGPTLMPRLKPAEIRRIVWVTLPLGVIVLLGQMRQTVPRTWLEASFGEEAVGIYAALSYVVIAGSTVVMALGQSSLARLSQHYAARRLDAFRRLGLRLAMIGVAVGVASVGLAHYAGPFLLARVYAPEYAEYSRLFVLIVAAGALFWVATLLGPVATAIRAFRSLMVVQALSVAVLLGASAALIPSHGMYGAAWAVMAATVASIVGYLVVIRSGLRRAEAE